MLDKLLCDADTNSVLSNLRKYGIAVVPSFISANILNELRNEFYRFFSSQSRAIYLRHKHPTNQYGVISRAKKELLDETEFPLTKELFGSDFMNEIVKKYYAPYEYKLNDDIFITHEKPCDIPILPWHFDRMQALKFYIYLKDTTKDDGAFEYVPGSHNEGHYRANYHLLKGLGIKELPNDIPDDEILYPITINGKAGDLIIFDPDGFHRGGIVSEGGERMVMRGHSHPVGDGIERILGDAVISKASKNRDDEFKLNNRI